jgi:hypothetical protein
MVVLVTYLPFYRLHEVVEFFAKNVEIVKPSKAIAFIDNVYHEKQKEKALKLLPHELEYVFGNWGSRNDTWIAMLRKLRNDYSIKGDVIFVDSDNILTKDFLKYHELLASYGLYGVLDYESWFLGAENLIKRSIRKDYEHTIFMYKVYEPKNYFKGGPPFFWGPKQAIYLRTLPSEELVNGLEKALAHVTPYIRNLLPDESLLGVLAWLTGFEYVPWTVASHHFHHRSGRKAEKLLIARVYMQFAKGLWSVFKRKEFLAYYLKYKAVLLKESIKALIE